MKNPFLPLFQKDTRYFSHIEGLRALSAIRVMLTHIVILASLFYSNTQYSQLLQLPTINKIHLPEVLLDSFFVISGFVISYSLISAYKNTAQFSCYEFFIRRCARILPLYLVTIVIAFPSFYINFHNLWTNILFINNYITMPAQYAGWTWALAVEIQFYCIFAIIMLLLSKNYIGKKTCQALAIGFFLMPFVVITSIIVQHQYYYLSRFSYFLLSKEGWFFIDHGFDKLYIRSAPILYGIFSAYLLIYHKEFLKDFQKKCSPLYFDLICLLIISTIAFVWVNNPPDFFDAPGKVWQTSTFWGLLFQHQLYSAALALLLILADAPKGFILKALVKILSSVILRPFGRLSFTTYMIHPAIFMLGYSIYFSLYPNLSFSMYIQKGFLFILLSYLLAIPCYLWIEMPAMAKIKERYLNNKKRRWLKMPTSSYQQ